LDAPGATFKETDRLADIGLDSLRRLNLVALIEEEQGISVAEEHVTHNTTVAQLRKLISDGTTSSPPEQRVTWTYKRWVRLLGNGLREIALRGLLRIWVKMSVEGRDNLRGLNTPAIFIFNHIDGFDGPVVFQALPHAIRKRLAVAVADDVMREHRPLRFISRLCFAGFNFARSEPYMPSLEYVSHMIDQGWNVVISPEGRLSTTGKLQPFKSGIGLLAVELGVPVIPIKTIGLAGTVPLHANWPKKRSRVTVRIGQPIRFNAHDNYDEATLKLHHIMETL
jgi:long-chain acyl-CoA synthetase